MSLQICRNYIIRFCGKDSIPLRKFISLKLHCFGAVANYINFLEQKHWREVCRSFLDCKV